MDYPAIFRNCSSRINTLRRATGSFGKPSVATQRSAETQPFEVGSFASSQALIPPSIDSTLV
jgi:hypothetical protein